MVSGFLLLAVLCAAIGIGFILEGLPLDRIRQRFGRPVRPRHILMERLGKKDAAVPAPTEGTPVAPRPAGRRNLLPLLTSLLTKTRAQPIIAQIDQALVLARIPLKAAEFLYISAAALFLALLIVQIVSTNVIVALLVTLAAGFAPFYFLRVRQALRFLKIDYQVADALLLMTNSLRSGTSFMDAMDTVSHEMPPPISDEFARSLRDVTLGVPVEEAFQKMSQRCHSEDLDLAVTAFMIQREVGGNLAEILENIGETIRVRVKLKQEIRTLTAQGKLSGGILCLLPIGLTGLLAGLNPTYMHLLFSTAPGKMMLGVGGALQVVGVLAISRIIRIEV